MHYLISENKGADQLRSYCEADLRLCFRRGRLLVFPWGGSFLRQVVLGAMYNVGIEICLTSQATAAGMSERCLHFVGLYSTLECHDMQNLLQYNYNHPIKQLRFICMDGLTKPLFLDRLRPSER